MSIWRVSEAFGIPRIKKCNILICDNLNAKKSSHLKYWINYAIFEKNVWFFFISIYLIFWKIYLVYQGNHCNKLYIIGF